MATAAQTLAAYPKLNRFVVGKRLYQRKHAEITFSVKRKRLDGASKLAAVKLRFTEGEPFEHMCRRINEQIEIERSDAKTYTDKELGFFTKLPRPVLALCLGFMRWLDYHNLAPASFIEHDGFYTSAFIANLGSLGMSAVYHHLYEYGTCPVFMTVGRIEERPWVEDGNVVVRKVLPIRWSYDERIDDGLTAKGAMDAVRERLEQPAAYFGDPEAPRSSRERALGQLLHFPLQKRPRAELTDDLSPSTA